MFRIIYFFDVRVCKQFSGYNFPCILKFKFIHTQIKHECGITFKRPIICFSDVIREFKLNNNYVNRYLYNIISYLPLLDSSTGHSHVTTFAMQSGGKVKSTSTLILVVIFSACVCHWITTSFRTIFYKHPSNYNRGTTYNIQ